MRTKRAKQLVTVILVIWYIFFVAITQPLFFEVHTYFGINALFIVMPIAFPVIVLFILHIYQNWALMLQLFKKSPDKTKQRKKMQRLVARAFLNEKELESVLDLLENDGSGGQGVVMHKQIPWM